MRVRSRLSGVDGELPSNGVLPSHYWIPSGTRARVVPDGLATDDQPEFLTGWPDALSLWAVDRVVEGLAGVRSWDEWVGTIPLVPRIDETARLSRFDRLIVENLSHLQHVCHKPRLQLKIEEERLPISRARRVPARATGALVSHPEDWEHRTLRDVRPSRILATQVEDLCDVYENRVAARLVDKLLKYVGPRVEKLREIKAMHDQGNDFLDATRGGLWRGSRLFELWGQMFVDDALSRQLAEALQAMERVQRELRALLDSRLYVEVPRNAFVGLSLRPTNILLNDSRYREVANLWREWAIHGHVPEPTRDELRRERQTQCGSFDRFALLVVLRALVGLGMAPPPGAMLESGRQLKLVGPRGASKLRLSDDGVVLLSSGNQELRIVPMLARLGAETFPRLWQALVGDVRTSTVVILLGRQADVSSNDRALELAINAWAQPKVLVASPWSIDSVERASRVLGSWLAVHALPHFPTAQVKPDPGVVLPNWLWRDGDSVIAIAPPNGGGAAFDSECARKLTSLKAEQERARVSRQAFDPGRINALGPLRELARAAEHLAALADCPVCGKNARERFEPRVSPGSAATWTCRCDGCSSQWGTRVCGSCKETFPVLSPGGARPHPGGDRPPADWIDRSFGRDLWAVPCWRPDRPDTYRCSRCNSCPCGGCSFYKVGSPSTENGRDGVGTA